MNLDRACLFFCLSLLPLWVLPAPWLAEAVKICLFFAAVFACKRQWLGVLFSLPLALSYAQVQQLSHQAEQIDAGKFRQQVKIVQILRQMEYETAIAEQPDGSRLYLTWLASTPLKLAAQYQIEGNLRPISGRANKGNFQRQRWYFAQRIQALATVKHATLLPEQTSSLRANWLEKALQETADLSQQGLLLAVSFGERAWLSPQVWQHFQQTATAHIIAISGSHIGLVFFIGVGLAKAVLWLAFYLRDCLAFRPKIPVQAVKKPQNVVARYLLFNGTLAYLAGFLLAGFYSYLAGFAVPTVRAMLAISVFLACQFSRRYFTPWQLWWRVVCLLLILDPLAMLSDSFWLSILAVASLIFWYAHFPLRAFLSRLTNKKLPFFHRLCLNLIHLQLGIWLVFSPVQLAFFEGTSPFAFWANLLLVPIYALFLIPLSLFSLFSQNAFNSWQLANQLAEISLRLLSPMSGSWWHLSQSQQLHLLLFNALCLLLIYTIIHHHPLRWFAKFTAVLLLIWSVLLLWFTRSTPEKWITFDVGQGLAQALIYTDNAGEKRAILYDTGASWGKAGEGNSMANMEILPYFRRHGIHLEALFLSHDDNDHSGGVADLLNAFPEARFISASQKAYAGRQPEACEQGKDWQFGNFRLSALHPPQQKNIAKNPDSCTILVNFHRLKLLFTGDIGSLQEHQLAPRLPKLTALQIPHHGSKNSSSQAFLAQTQPDFAVISTGRWNPWKMPNEAVLKRLESQQIQWFSTHQAGMIEAELFADSLRFSFARNSLSPWYQRFIDKKSADFHRLNAD